MTLAPAAPPPAKPKPKVAKTKPKSPAAFEGIRPLRWTRERYEAATDAGVFDGLRLERIGGKLIEMSPQNEPGVYANEEAAEWCRATFPASQFQVRTNRPLAVDRWSDPEPDVAVISGPRRRGQPCPTTAVLVIEVSESSLRHDRRKARRYAGAKVGDYWILNLVDRTLEVHRDPVRGLGGRWQYRDVKVLPETDSITPLAAPNAAVTVADLLP